MEKSRNYPALTGLKGIFCLVILWFHTLPKTPLVNSIPLSSFISKFGGTLGNYIFFMLSGFLIASSYKARISSHSLSFSDYLVKRLRKLYPLYLLSNLVMLLLEVLEYGMSVINLQRIAYTLLLQAGSLDPLRPYNIPSWFLCVLFLCYISYYAISYFSKNTTFYRCCLAFFIILGHAMLSHNWTIPYFLPDCGGGFLNFFIGCALAEVYPYITEKQNTYLRYFSFFSLIGSGYLLIRYGVEIISGDSQMAFAFVICPLILCLALSNGLCGKLLQCKPMLYLGKISMSLYFWHYCIYTAFVYVYHLWVPDAPLSDLLYLAYFALTIILSILSQKLLEKPSKSLVQV